MIFSQASQDVITIDSDEDDEDGGGSVGSEIILISDSEPEDNLFADYEVENQINLEEDQGNQDIKGTFPLVIIHFFLLSKIISLWKKRLLQQRLFLPNFQVCISINIF